MESFPIETKTAGSIGLIINELATNAIKHGFNSQEEPRFTIDMQSTPSGEEYILAVSNTGNPFPDGIDLQNPDSLGLQLISTLVDQIDGSIELVRRPNTEVRIRFPVDLS